MNFVNLTLHAIVIRDADKVDFVIEPSGAVARVSSAPGVKFQLPGGLWRARFSSVFHTAPTFGDVEGLPGPVDGTFYIVSSMVAQRVSRDDVYSPGTGPQDGAIRNELGQVVAVTRLIRSTPAVQRESFIEASSRSVADSNNYGYNASGIMGPRGRADRE